MATLVAVENGWYDVGDGKVKMVIIGVVVADNSQAALQCPDCFEAA